MSRSFQASYKTYSESTYVLCDPLVFNFEGNTADITDQKFMFDLDCDGKEEEISSLGKGSGFLALDKNGDGIVNDGTELFGTKSGDGFADLAEYDEDGNGWIDEDDGTVFIYYASSDTRMHVATSTIDKLVDYCMNTPADGLSSSASVETLKKLIDKNLQIMK